MFFVARSPVANAGGINDLNYQGRLLNSAGAIVADGSYNMEFKIYASTGACASGNTLDWTEDWTYNSTMVTVKNGYFSVPLGSITAFGSSVNWTTSTLCLSINIGGTNTSGTITWDGEMSPFQMLTASPYAQNSSELGGLTASQFVQLAPTAVQVDSGTLSSIFINKTGTSGDILELQKGGADTAVIGNTGTATFENTSNSTAAFNVENNSGYDVLGVDTTNGYVNVGNISTTAAQDVTGVVQLADGTTDGFGLKVETNTLTGNQTIKFPNASGTVCLNTQNCNFTGTGYIVNNTTTQSGNFNVQAASSSSVAGTLEGNASGTADILDLVNGSAAKTATFGYQGSDVFQTSTNATTAFQVEGAPSTTGTVLDVDTTNGRVGINTSTPGTGLDVQGGIQQTGMQATGAGSSGANEWTELGSCTLTVVHTNCQMQINIAGSDNANSIIQSTVTAWVRQQAAMGSAPLISLYVDNALEAQTLNDFETVTTTNNGTQTVVQLWMMYNINFITSYFSPTFNDGNVQWVWAPSAGLNASLPAGTQTTASYGDSVANTLDLQTVLANQTNALEVQTSNGDNLFNIDTTNSNLITNSSIETNTTGWSGKGSATIAQSSTKALFGNNSLKVSTTATANDGAEYAYNLASSTTYTFSVFVETNSGTVGTFELGRSENGSTNTTCTTAQTAFATQFQEISCTFLTGTTSGSTYLYIDQSDAVSRVFYVDGAQLTATGTLQPYEEGHLSFNGNVDINAGTTAAATVPSALQVNTANGNNGLLVVGSNGANVNYNAFNVEAADGVSLLRTNETAAVTYVEGGSSFWNTPAFDVQSLVAGEAAENVQSESGQTANTFNIQDNNGATESGFGPSGGLVSYGNNTNLLDLSAPSSITPSLVAGGSLATGTTYYYEVTATDNQGLNETVSSGSVNDTPTTGNDTIKLTWAQVNGATGYKVYRNTTNTFTSGSLLLAIVSNGTTPTYTDTGTTTGPTFPPTAPTGTTLTLQAWSGQTANAFAVENSGGTTTAAITAGGNIDSASAFDVLTNTALDIGNANATSVNIGNTGTNNTTTINGVGVVETNGSDSTNAFMVENHLGSADMFVDTANDRTTVGAGASLGQTLSVNGTAEVGTSSTTAFQVETGGTDTLDVDTTDGYVGIGTNAPAAPLDVRGGITQSGFSTPNSGSGGAGEWTELAQCTIITVNTQCETVINLTGNQGTATTTVRATLTWRIREAGTIANPPIVNLQVDNVMEDLGYADFMAVNTTTGGTSEVEQLWMELPTTNMTIFYAPTTEDVSSTNDTWAWTPQTALQAALPAGTQTAAVFGDNYANSLLVNPSANSTTSFVVDSFSPAGALFTVDTTDGRVIVGSTSSNTSTALLVLNNYTTAGSDPSGLNGAMYYNVGDSLMRCYEGGEWKNCISIDPDDQREQAFYSEPFLDTGASSVWAGAAISSGTVSAATGVANHPGGDILKSSTTASSGYRFFTNTASSVMTSGGQTFEAIFNPTTTSGTTEYLGFSGTNSGAAPANGVFINITGTTLEGQSCSASTCATTGTTQTIVAGTWYRVRITVNSAGNSISYQAWTDGANGGTSLWSSTTTTDIPTTAVGSGVVAVNSGTTAVSLLTMDYMAQWQASGSYLQR
ncbi:MAG TPA: hypothetical protein VGS28_02555 [Candidatus Saccharimonadales bacterium]|nr:hypothetical protein [Candidatus Saccharimonadales bacterium]